MSFAESLRGVLVGREGAATVIKQRCVRLWLAVWALGLSHRIEYFWENLEASENREIHGEEFENFKKYQIKYQLSSYRMKFERNVPRDDDVNTNAMSNSFGFSAIRRHSD
jgi:hypothetical protein